MNSRDVPKLAESLKALSDPTRLRLVLALGQKGEQTVTDLTRALKLPQPKASHHLAILRHRGLVRSRRDGKCVFYSIHATQIDWLHRALEGLLPTGRPRRRR